MDCKHPNSNPPKRPCGRLDTLINLDAKELSHIKRIFCLISALALVACLLTACGKDAPSPSNGGTPFGRPVGEQDFKFSAEWPENELTKQVPKPDFKTTPDESSEADYVVVCKATVDQLKDYVARLKEAGFTVNENTTEENAFGMSAYIYTASNAEGYTVEVHFTNTLGSMTTITIKKPA